MQTTGGGVSSTYFYLTDNLGSLLAVFNNVTSNAVLLSTQLYAPYGSSRYAAGPQLSTYTGKGYTGQYSDAVSGLDYYNARYYDPVSGVFLSADTMQGNDQGMNPYAYAGNNPTTNADPSGHAPNDLDPAIVQFFQQLAVNGVALWNLFLSYLSPTPAGTFPPPNVNQATIQQQQTAEGMQVPPAYDNLIEGQLAGQNVQDDNKGNSTSDGEDPNDPSTRTLPRNPGATGNQTAKNQSKNGGKIIRNKSGNGYKQYHYQVLAEEKKLNVEIQYQDALQKAAAYPMGTVVSGGASLGGSWWSQLWERVGSYVQQTSEDFYQSVNNFKIDEGPSTVPETDPGGVPGPIDPGVDPELPLAPGFTILFAFLFRR